jgi:hypothetical protein
MGFLIVGVFPPTVSNWIITVIVAVLLVLVLIELVRLLSDTLRSYYAPPRGVRFGLGGVPPARRAQQQQYTMPDPGPGAMGGNGFND